MSKRIIHLIVGAFILVVSVGLAFGVAADKEKAVGSVDKTTTNDDYKVFNINNIFNYYANNGDGSYNKFSGNGAFEFPKTTGSPKTAIYEDGVVWGGFHKERQPPGVAKVGGSVYRHGIQAGKILTPGTLTTPPVADDPLKPEYHVYRVRADIRPTSTLADQKVADALNFESQLISRYESYSAQDLLNLYISDWNNWPAKTAANPAGLAPFTDVDSNGVYDPTVDIPGQPGSDQTLYYVANDVNESRTQFLAGCPPIGLEVHRTFWGYNRQGALGQTIFASTLIINKSGAPVDSMFFVQWSDPDLGDSGDDYAGCDTTRSLGFIYNGRPSDATYGTEVPSAGYDFFQGPIVPAAPEDSAVFRLQYRHGFKNLGMTTFVFFSQGFADYSDPAQGNNGDREWYRLMNGLTAAGRPFTDPTTGNTTKFTLYGDPVTGQGWLDGMAGLTPQDRRMCLVTGPFTMANADTQELVVATLVGLGNDRISSVAVLKWYSDLAQFAYNSLFNIPTPPPAPQVNVAQLNNSVSLTWGDPSSYPGIESHLSGGYKFQGYNVYQLPEPSFNRSAAKRLATYDVIDATTTVFDDEYDPATGYVLKKPVLFGTDSGLKHDFSTTTDALNSRNLVNGTTYYFAVTAYAVNPDPEAKPTYLESSPQILSVVPQSNVPGTRYSALGDTVKGVTQSVAAGGSSSEGQVIPIIVDPGRLTGDTYQVTFHNVTDTTTHVTTTLWDLTNTTKGIVVLKDQANQSGDEEYAVVDGMLVKVTGPLTPGMKDWDIPNGTRHWTWVNANWGAEGFGGAIGNGYDQWFSGSTVTYDKLRNVLIKLAATDANGNVTDPNDPNYSFGYRYMRGAGSAPAKPEFAPFILNASGGYAFQEYVKNMPLAAFNEETNPPTRLMVGFLENNAANALVNGRYWPGYYNAPTDNIASSGPREWMFIFDVPYSETMDPSLAVDILNNTLPLMWFATVNRRDQVGYAAGDEFLILANHLNTPANSFTFTTPKPTVGDKTLAKADVEKINVFPNPYIGFNPLEQNKYERFVTFNHLPARAIVRVFNLAGTLVRTLRKDDPTQFFQWDLRNENGFPVAAGMYIVFIDMPDLGKTKTLKLGVIPEQQFIDRW